ncbi:MAG: hypothetical protein H0T46_06260 [Deltaproteobacteria bacterium]|nr:hypothetical protein [Deltaproteobacteria bacterium]
MSGASYEFTAGQNETFKGLVSGMRRSGGVVALASLILLAYQIVEYFGLGLGAVPPAAIGYLDLTVWCLLSVVGVIVAVLLVKATGAFTAVIQTEGNDVEHLMEGLVRLRSILNLIFVAAAVGSALLGVSFALLLIY